MTFMQSARIASAGSVDPMLSSLVMGSGDSTGLLAYAMHVQCKDEWRDEFKRTFGREPDAHEAKVYELGELTARRQVSYRFLADARIAGRYTKSSAGGSKHSLIQKLHEHRARADMLGPAWQTAPLKIGLGILVGLGVIGLLAAISAAGVARPFAAQMLQ